MDLCIIISDFPLFTETVGFVLFGNELALFCDNIICMYHVRKKLKKNYFTPLIQKPK